MVSAGAWRADEPWRQGGGVDRAADGGSGDFPTTCRLIAHDDGRRAQDRTGGPAHLAARGGEIHRPGDYGQQHGRATGGGSMQEVRRDGERVVVEVTLDELRLITGAVNEALNGPYAIPVDDWEALVGQPPERADALLDSLSTILERQRPR
jgi:hypothetical protein